MYLMRRLCVKLIYHLHYPLPFALFSDNDLAGFAVFKLSLQ